MPPADLILSSLTAIANDWRSLAIAWHAYFVALAVFLVVGRARRRVAGALLVPPVVSVSALAWSSGNGFNGGVFALLALVLAGTVMRMSKEPAKLASPTASVPGALLFLFGFGYPHFLSTDSWVAYAYAAPLGLVPCPSLAALIGVTLMFGLFRERAWAVVLASAGLFYGVVGVFRLGVVIDLALLGGATALTAGVLASAVRSVRADEREHGVHLPGDELIAEPIAALTHAITIHRPRRDVWPWLAQMGAGRRAGWYSYDFLDNGRQPSASRIVPELQRLEPGMIFPALPEVTDGFRLLSFERDRSLVLGWGPPSRPPTVTWAFHLEDAGKGGTRLIVRVAGGQDYRFRGLPVFLTKPLVRLVHFIMERKQLLGIARRVEMQPGRT